MKSDHAGSRSSRHWRASRACVAGRSAKKAARLCSGVADDWSLMRAEIWIAMTRYQPYPGVNFFTSAATSVGWT